MRSPRHHAVFRGFRRQPPNQLLDSLAKSLCRPPSSHQLGDPPSLKLTANALKRCRAAKKEHHIPTHCLSGASSLLVLGNCRFMFLRSHPHTPGRYPGCFTNSLCFGFPFFVGVKGEVWGPIFPGALWAKSLNVKRPRLKELPQHSVPQQKPTKKPRPLLLAPCRMTRRFFGSRDH